MKTALSLLLLALVCGVWKRVDAETSKHFEMVHSWSGIDYVFPDVETKIQMILNKSFVPGTVVPYDIAIEASTGRIFLTLVQDKTVAPASVATVSATTDSKGEHLMQPYPDWSWHARGCDGFTSVEQLNIDECGRLWLMDTGVAYSKGAFDVYTRICPPRIFVFDLKTDQLIKKFEIPEHIVLHDAAFSTIAVDILNTDDACKNTFAYVADSGYYGMIVYDFAHDDAWRVYGNQFYPYPEFGHFDIKNVHFDYMYGIYGEALAPKHDGEDRTLFFNSFSGGKMSYVSTSLLKNKTNFEGVLTHDLMYHITSNIHTYSHLMPGGQMGAIAMDSYGVMYLGSLHENAIYCWNSKKAFDDQHIVLVDEDEEKFQTLMKFQVVKTESGALELYALGNNFQDFLFTIPDTDKTRFRILKAPLPKLIEGTTCMNGIEATSRK